MKRATIDLWVGIFAALGCAAMLFLALKTANLTVGSGSNGTYSLYAEFDNIGGLKVKAPGKAGAGGRVW
jgi:phospholipid/cholesterol/gamma-HCH transport system substrate-binding protein